MIIFTVNLLAGLLFSQLMPEWLASAPQALSAWKTTVKVCTMWCLSYIMIHVGYEFDVDKTRLCSYAKDYAVGMTAAGVPWIAVAFWFMWALPHPLGWKEALVAARFAAPTSAGILFAMLEAAGLKETWLFRKARVLAIFDDLGTILLMVPLKVIVVGFKWELSIDLVMVVVCFSLMGCCLHRLGWPCSWHATMGYATVIAAASELMHFFTHDSRIDPADVVETVHLEVLLPAFTVGCIVRAAHTSQLPDTRFAPSHPNHLVSRTKSVMHRLRHSPSIKRERRQLRETFINDLVSCIFMLLVGLSMPSLFGTGGCGGGGGHRRLAPWTVVPPPFDGRMLAASAGGNATAACTEAESLPAAALVGHVVAVSALMVVGKLFPVFVYRDEAPIATRLALALGMCPRGEVGAGVIVVSLTFGIGGDAITIAVICLALNLVASSLFILGVKRLALPSVDAADAADPGAPETAVPRVLAGRSPFKGGAPVPAVV